MCLTPLYLARGLRFVLEGHPRVSRSCHSPIRNCCVTASMMSSQGNQAYLSYSVGLGYFGQGGMCHNVHLLKGSIKTGVEHCEEKAL